MTDLTQQEERAIAALERVAKIWPDSLWLFSASGSLCVMKKNADGSKPRIGTGHDEKAVVTSIAIENDGGDW